MTDHALRIVLLVVLLVPAAPAQAQDPKPAPPPTTVDASNGGVTISSGVNSLTIGARTQVRWIVEDKEEFDADRQGSGVGEADDPLSQFDVARLRVTLSGGAFRPWLRYLLQFEFSRTSGDGDSKIKDAILEIRPVGRNVRFQAGQFKAPFGMQQLTSSGRLQFVDRAITDAKFSPGREMGAMFSGAVANRKVGYELGAFNASGESVRQTNSAMLWAGRVFFEPLGTYALSEGSSDAGQRPVLHLGAAVRGGDPIRGRITTGVVDGHDDQVAYSVEFAFKSRRLYSTAEHFWMTDDREGLAGAPVTTIDSRGYHAQIGFMILPRTTEVGVRYASVDGDTSRSASDVTELRGVVGYYWQAHNLKLQADFGRTRFDSAFASMSDVGRQGLPALGTRLASDRPFSDKDVRVQLQLTF